MPTSPILAAAAALALLILASPAPAAERRCGWLENPTPANLTLRDRGGEWMLSIQMQYEAEGVDAMPDMSKGGWVETNGSYGYGCACLVVETDRKQMRVTRLVSARPEPLARCRKDRLLPQP